MKKTLCVLMVAVMLFSLLACAPKEEVTDPSTSTVQPDPSADATIPPDTEKDYSNITVTFGLASAWTTLNPYGDVTSYAMITYDLLYDTLVFQTAEENFPRAAESWSANEDSTIFTFKLDKDAAWHDGTPVTANDWVFAAQLLTDPDYTAAPQKASVFSLFAGTDDNGNELSENSVGWKAVDEYTLEMTMKIPMLLDSFLAANNKNLRAMPAHLLKDIPVADVATAAFWQKPVGDGPLMFDSEVAGNELILKTNPAYHLGAPKFGTMILRVYSSDALAAAYMAGELDVCNNAMTMDDCLTAVAMSDKIEMIRQEFASGYVVLSFNHEVFDDARVRKAISYSVDYDTLNQVLYNGDATIAACPWLPRGDYYNQDYCGTEYNLEKAKALLDEANFDFSRVYTLSTATGYRATAAQIIQASLKEIGVKVDIQTGDAATVLDNQRTGVSDLGIWGDSSITPDPNTAAQRYVKYASSTFSYGLSEQYKEMFDRFALSIDPAERKAISDEIQEFYMNDCPQVLLFVFPKYSLKTKRLQNYNYDAMMLYNQDVWNWVITE